MLLTVLFSVFINSRIAKINKWVQIWTRTNFVFRIRMQYTQKVHCVGGGLCIL